MVMRSDGSEQIPLSHVGSSSNLFPTWSPDSKAIAFISHRKGAGEIMKMADSGGTMLNLTRHPANDNHPSWSPDGKTIAFVSDRSVHSNIYLLDLATKRVRRLLKSELLLYKQ